MVAFHQRGMDGCMADNNTKVVTWVVGTIVSLCAIVTAFFSIYFHMNSIHEPQGASAGVATGVLTIVEDIQATKHYWLGEKEKTTLLSEFEKGRKRSIEQSLGRIEKMQRALGGELNE